MPKVSTSEELLARYANGERDFDGSDLSSAILIGADLRDVRIRNATLMYAQLSGANLSGANLVVCQA